MVTHLVSKPLFVSELPNFFVTRDKRVLKSVYSLILLIVVEFEVRYSLVCHNQFFLEVGCFHFRFVTKLLTLVHCILKTVVTVLKLLGRVQEQSEVLAEAGDDVSR